MRFLSFQGVYGLTVLAALISLIVMVGVGATGKEIVIGICAGIFSGVALIMLTKIVIDEIEEGRREYGVFASLYYRIRIVNLFRLFWLDMAASSGVSLEGIDWKTREFYLEAEKTNLNSVAKVRNPYFALSLMLAPRGRQQITWKNYSSLTIDAIRREIDEIFIRYSNYLDPRLTILLQALGRGFFLGQFKMIYAGMEFIRHPPDGQLFDILEEDIKSFSYLEESIEKDYAKIRFRNKERLRECMTLGVVGITEWLPPYD